jgi:hypothetical protein
MSNLRLFCLKFEGKALRDPKTGDTMWFDCKVDAKKARDALGRGTTVSRGPDNQKSARGYPAPMRQQPAPKVTV